MGLSGPFQTFDTFILPLRRLNRALHIVLVGLATSLAVVLVVYLVNFASFGIHAMNAVSMLVLAGYVMAITFAVIASLALFSPGAEAREPVRILQRIPVQLRAPLQSLSVQDHYTEVRTDKGTHLVLIRLPDAMAEAGAVEGLQIHRSHWVALAAVTQVERKGGKVLVTLRGGTTLPASRSNIPALKAAGLLV